MSFIPLSEIADKVGYPRSEFISGRKSHCDFPVSYQADIHKGNPDGYYVSTNGHKIKGYEGYSLVRKKGNDLNQITSQVPNHLYSSIIKNIIISGDYEEELKYNMVLYILYYRVAYRANNELNDEQLTEGVVYELSNLIKIMIDREVTTYKNNPYISDAIDDMRRLLKRERIHLGIRPKLNLRR